MSEQSADHADVKIHPPVLMLLHVGAAFLTNWLIPLPLAAPRGWETFGLALGFIGFLLGAAAAVEFGRAHTTLNPHGAVSKLVTTGIYRFTRNPIYLGFVLITVGVPLALNNFWGIAFTPLLVIFFNALVVRHEEAYLQKKFGDEYAGYKSRVRRWV
jgi:protein-S-isoprenylcysteine O-methyltransferase Ste14